MAQSKIKTISLILADDFEIIITGYYTPPAPDNDDTGPGTAARFEIINIDGDVCSAMIFTSDYQMKVLWIT